MGVSLFPALATFNRRGARGRPPRAALASRENLFESKLARRVDTAKA